MRALHRVALLYFYVKRKFLRKTQIDLIYAFTQIRFIFKKGVLAQGKK